MCLNACLRKAFLVDVYTSCFLTEDTCIEGDVRLMGGSDAKEGWVEICINNTWGIVCNDKWTDKNTEIVCQQLGLDGK